VAVVVNLLPHMCVLCQSIVCGCWFFMDKFTFWMCYDVRPHGLLCVVSMFKFVTSGHSFINPQHDAFCVTRLGARRHGDVSFSFGSPVWGLAPRPVSLPLCAIIGPEAFRSGDSETAPDVSTPRKDNEGERMASDPREENVRGLRFSFVTCVRSENVTKKWV
jgi:hypothetical protein